jgi:hypothetical protein
MKVYNWTKYIQGRIKGKEVYEKAKTFNCEVVMTDEEEGEEEDEDGKEEEDEDGKEEEEGGGEEEEEE